MKNNTKCVHAGNINDEITGGVITPIYTSTSNGFDIETNVVFYPRYLNIPTQKVVADKIAQLENAEEAIVLSSGMAAISSVLYSLLKAGDHAIFFDCLYGGTSFLITSELNKFNIEYTFVDNIESFKNAIKPNTKLVYIESPSNPLLQVIDIPAVVSICKENNILSVIDNTFATPINQQPLILGMDVVIHSATKYLNGHSDLICGVIATSKELMSIVKPYVINHGGILNSQDCYLLERGMKTLALRVNKQNENALNLAQYLESHSKLKKVNYPGLQSSPYYELAKGQMSGFGGMLSFELDCSADELKKVLCSFNLFKEVISLGGVESLVCIPAKTTHVKMTPEQRYKAGISDTLLRVSVGIEDIEDLIDDMEQALSVL